MKLRFALNIALSIPLLGMPLYSQHGHGGGGGASADMGHSMDHASKANSGANSTKGSGSKAPSVSERLQDNTKLSSKLQGLLPSGTNVQQAAQGFKNLGQFVAAVHVSHNLGIPFDQLKTKMVGPPSESLGKAIHALKPDVKSSDETKKAEKQAKQDIDDSKAA